MISDEEINSALNWLRDNAVKSAQARADRLYMEQWVKTVLAQEQAKNTGMSVAAQEVHARISEPYLASLTAYKQAIFEDERLRFLTAAASAKIEAWRTQSSNARAEGKAYS